MNTLFQQTANCQFTICLTRGVHPIGMSSATLSILDLSPLFSAVSAHTHFADYFSQSATL